MKKSPGFTSFYKFEEFLKSLGLFRMNLGLERMDKGLLLLGIKPDQVPCVQVVGTNGKGSTACFLEAMARQHGCKTGLFTSPHLVSPKERIRVNSSILSDTVWLDAADTVLGACSSLDLTYFEFLTLLAVVIFKQQKVDLAVMEAGLGGRHDATSALIHAVHVFTPVGLDHIPILGTNLKEIARDKSMAMKHGPAVVGAQDEGVLQVLRLRADETGADFHYIPDFFEFREDVFFSRQAPWIRVTTDGLGLKGFYQAGNAATSLLAWHVFQKIRGCEVDPEKCRQGLKKAFWPGRMHFVSQDPLIILDGAHNPQALEVLKKALDLMYIRPSTIIFSCLEDKNPGLLSGIVRDMGADMILVPDIRDNPRAMPGETLVRMLGPNAHPLEDTAEYLGRITKEESPVLVCGSLYLLGDIYAAFPQWLVSQDEVD